MIGLFYQHWSLIFPGGNHKFSRGDFEISTEEKDNTSEESNETSEESNDKSEEFLVTSVENDKELRRNFANLPWRCHRQVRTRKFI